MTNHVLTIANSDQCCYCGACLGVCPGETNKNLLISDFTDTGWTLSIQNEDKCASCTLCIDSCPMNEVDYNAFGLNIEEEKQPHLLGSSINTFIGYSNNSETRSSGASGGVISEIVKYCFEQKDIDGVVCIKPTMDDRSNYSAFVARSHSEFVVSQGSHYFPLPAFSALSEVIYGKFRKVIVIGLPCHITSLRLSEERIKKLKKRVFLSIGLFCGGTTDFRLAPYLENRAGVDSRSQAIKFRQGHWPGAINVIENSDKSHELGGIHRDYHQFTALLPACMYCADHSAELADISVGDPWLPKILSRDDGGYSSIVTRTVLGNNVISEMIVGLNLICENSSPDEVIEGQRGPIDFKKRGLAPRLYFKSLFTGNVPIIKNATLIKSDFVDYFAAFVMLALYRVSKLPIFWRINNQLPTKLINIYTKPINFIMKRNHILLRVFKKILPNNTRLMKICYELLNLKTTKLNQRIWFKIKNTILYQPILLKIRLMNSVSVPGRRNTIFSHQIDYDHINGTYMPSDIKHADSRISQSNNDYDFMNAAEKNKFNGLILNYIHKNKSV